MCDWIPGLSQIKSVVQAIFGDYEGAIRTQENFSRQCPVVSQFRSSVELIFVNQQAALETQFECGRIIISFFDANPLLGYVKGALHYALGDIDGGNSAIRAASRTLGVMVGGAAGYVTGGDPRAVLGGIASGIIIDVIITKIDSAVHSERRLYGLVRQIAEIKENPDDPGKWFDTFVMIAGDGLCGYVGGEAYVSVEKFLAKKAKAIPKKFERQQRGKQIRKPEKDIVRIILGVPENEPNVTFPEYENVFKRHNERFREYLEDQRQINSRIKNNYTDLDLRTGILDQFKEQVKWKSYLLSMEK